MVTNLIVGGLVMAFCVSIQSLFLALMMRRLAMLEKQGPLAESWLRATAVLVGSLSILAVGNLLQIGVWAGLFGLLGEFNDFATAFYHSVVNFSTLGYGDIVLSERHRLLGALEAFNGVLMVGLSTGASFAVASALMQRVWESRAGESGIFKHK